MYCSKMKSRALSILLALLTLTFMFSGLCMNVYAEETVQTVEVPAPIESESVPEETDADKVESIVSTETTENIPEETETVEINPVLNIEVPEDTLNISVPQETERQEQRIRLYLDRPDNYDRSKAEQYPDLLENVKPEETVTGFSGYADGTVHVFYPELVNSELVVWQWYKKNPDFSQPDIAVSVEPETEKPLQILCVCVPEDSGTYYVTAKLYPETPEEETLQSNDITVLINVPEIEGALPEPALTGSENLAEIGSNGNDFPGESEAELPEEVKDLLADDGITDIFLQGEGAETSENEETVVEENETVEEQPEGAEAQTPAQEALQTENQENQKVEEKEDSAEPVSMLLTTAPLLTGGLSEPEYNITSADENGRIVYIAGTNKDLVIRCDGPFAEFSSFSIDSDIMESGKDYSVEEGSTKLTLKSTVLETLSYKNYPITFTYSDGGKALADLVVTEVEVEIDPISDTVYNGKEQKPAVIVKTVVDGIVIPADQYDVTYKNNRDAGTATVTVKSKDTSFDVFEESASFTIANATPKVELKNKDAYYNGNPIEIDKASVKLVNGEQFAGNITYTYYTDSACTKALSTAPAGSGTYYVIARTPEFKNYNSSASNTAVLKIVYAAKKVTASVSASVASVISDTTREVIYGDSYSFRAKVYNSEYYIGRVYVNGVNVGAPDQYSDGTYYYTYKNTDPGEEKVTVVFQVYDRFGAPATGDESHLTLWTAVSVITAVCLLSLLTAKMRKKSGK